MNQTPQRRWPSQLDINFFVSSGHARNGNPLNVNQLSVAFRTSLPEVHQTINDDVAEGDQVAVRCGMRAAQQDSLLGFPPTNKSSTAAGINLWRIAYRIDEDAIFILEVFEKRTSQTPKHVIELCKQRLREYVAWKSGGSNG